MVYTSVGMEHRGELPELAMERVIDTLRRTSQAEVAVVFKQADSGVWKASLRSKDSVNVGEVARGLGGGGHRYAAGYTGHSDVSAMIAELLAALDAAAS